MKGSTIMLSLKPKWCRKILNGEKVYEIRSTLPKPFKPPYRILMYCTKNPYDSVLSGKVVGEFTCDKFLILPTQTYGTSVLDDSVLFGMPYRKWITDKACIPLKEFIGYSNSKKHLYAWHITDVKRYDVPVPVIGRGPQSWFYYNEKRLEV